MSYGLICILSTVAAIIFFYVWQYMDNKKAREWRTDNFDKVVYAFRRNEPMPYPPGYKEITQLRAWVLIMLFIALVIIVCQYLFY
jgi:hypothetical protein